MKDRKCYLFGKELFILFAASAFRKLSSMYVFSYFPFGCEGRIWDLIVSVPDHCLSFYFAFLKSLIISKTNLICYFTLKCIARLSLTENYRILHCVTEVRTCTLDILLLRMRPINRLCNEVYLWLLRGSLRKQEPAHGFYLITRDFEWIYTNPKSKLRMQTIFKSCIILKLWNSICFFFFCFLNFIVFHATISPLMIFGWSGEM